MPDRTDDFIDLDAAFGELRQHATAHVPAPGPADARRTVHRRRITRRIVASAAALALLAGTGLAVTLFRSDRQTIEITPGGTPSVTTPDTPSPTVLATPSGSARVPLFDLKTLDFQTTGATVRVPAVAGTCPAASVSLIYGLSRPVGGTSYRLSEPTVVRYGDLTGDGHPELVLVVDCRVSGVDRQALLVIAATGPKGYDTLAATALADQPVTEVLELRNGRISTHQRTFPGISAGRSLQVYRLVGDRLELVSGSGNPTGSTAPGNSAVQPCQAANVRVTVPAPTISGDVGSSSLVVTNSGPATCTITGYPAAMIFTSANGGAPWEAQITRLAGKAAKVTLRTGQRAAAPLTWHRDDDEQNICKNPTSFTLTLPNGGGTTTQPWTTAVGGENCYFAFEVSPFA